jgi:hypothetical protein
MKQDRDLVKQLTQQPSNQVWRAATAVVKGHVLGCTAEQAARGLYPDDPVTPLILRAGSTQATTTDPAWAGPLAQYAVSQAIEDIVAMTVAYRLEMGGALRIDLGRLASVTVPGRAVSPADAGTWVGEGQPIPVRQMNIFPGAKLTPTKLAVIVTLTREITEASNIEDVLKKLLTEAAGIALDTALFSTAAVSAVKPAGLLYGVTPLTPISSTLGFDACGQDMGLLVQDIATRGGGRNAFFIAAPKQATSIRFFAGGQFGDAPGKDILPVAASVGLPVGTVVCLEPESLVFTIADPQFSISSVAAVQQEDTTPTSDLTNATKSMYQIDAYALKMIVWASWGLRAPHVSFMSTVNW